MFGRKEAAVGGWDRLTEETQRGKRGASFAFVSLHSVIKLIAEKKNNPKTILLLECENSKKKKIIYN